MANSNGWGDGSANNAIGWGQGANNAISWGSTHATSYAGLTDIVGAPSFTGLLDTYSGASVAYSLRQLRTAYTGAAIRVRRSSDNAEQNIGFVNNVLDTASLLTFCGAGNGFVTTWYDQSGNANNSTQATAVNQAQIVSSGALILDSVTNKITTTWSNDRYNLTSGISTNTRYLSVSMWNRTSTINDMIALGNTSTIVTPVHWRSSSVANAIASIMNTSFIHDNIATTGRCVITSLKNASNLRIMYRNGVQLTSTTTDAPASDTLNCFGQSQSYIFTSGQCQEYIYWNSEQSANRTGIENNIKTYWNAY
jgi:hypothetical protein